jgi:GT2 family glycosyltransferase
VTIGRPDEHRDAPPRLVSVVIPCRHAGDLLARQLECLAGQDYAGAWEVVLADNTIDRDVATLSPRFAGRLPELRVADASGGSGASHARNVGVAEARGDFLAFCDADDEVDPGWIANLVETGARYDLVGGAVDEVALNDSDAVAARAPMGVETGLLTLLDFLPFAVGTNCGIWASVLEAIGGWNEGYPRANDVEMSWRAQVRGYTIGFAPKAVVRYRHRSTRREMLRQFYGWGCADAQLFHDFRDEGLARALDASVWRTWLRLLKWVPAVWESDQRRSTWLSAVARAAGRLRGSLRWRVYFP